MAWYVRTRCGPNGSHCDVVAIFPWLGFRFYLSFCRSCCLVLIQSTSIATVSFVDERTKASHRRQPLCFACLNTRYCYVSEYVSPMPAPAPAQAHFRCISDSLPCVYAAMVGKEGNDPTLMTAGLPLLAPCDTRHSSELYPLVASAQLACPQTSC